MTVTTNQLYSAIQDFKHYVQDNFPFKLTSYSGELDPSVTGFIANVPSIYFQVSNTGTVIKTFIKTEQSVNTAWAELGAGGGSLSPWEYKNTNFAAVDGGRYVVDTSVLPLTLTLPDNPTDGFSISVIDATYSFELNNLSLVSSTGTYTIESETLPIILDIDGISIDLIFVEATNNFRLVVNQGKAGSGIYDVIEGNNVVIDKTDPLKPIINATVGGGKQSLAQINYMDAVTAQDNRLYIVDTTTTDVSPQETSLTLPTVLPNNFTFSILDVAGSLQNAPLTIKNPAGVTLFTQSDLDNYLDVNYLYASFVYLASTNTLHLVNSSINILDNPA